MSSVYYKTVLTEFVGIFFNPEFHSRILCAGGAALVPSVAWLIFNTHIFSKKTAGGGLGFLDDHQFTPVFSKTECCEHVTLAGGAGCFVNNHQRTPVFLPSVTSVNINRHLTVCCFKLLVVPSVNQMTINIHLSFLKLLCMVVPFVTRMTINGNLSFLKLLVVPSTAWMSNIFFQNDPKLAVMAVSICMFKKQIAFSKQKCDQKNFV